MKNAFSNVLQNALRMHCKCFTSVLEERIVVAETAYRSGFEDPRRHPLGDDASLRS